MPQSCGRLETPPAHRRIDGVAGYRHRCVEFRALDNERSWKAFFFPCRGWDAAWRRRWLRLRRPREGGSASMGGSAPKDGDRLRNGRHGPFLTLDTREMISLTEVDG